MAGTIDSFESHLARKMQLAAVKTHANNLLLKDCSASHFSLDVSLASDILCPANCSPLFSQTNLSLESRLISPASRLSLLGSPTKEVDLSGLSHGALSASKLQEILNASKPGIAITLPGEKWQLSGLVIRNSVSLRGCPGATLEFSSKVQISSSGSEPCSQVLFSEITFILRDSDSSPIALFVIDSGKVELILNDCYCSNQSSVSVPACFWLNKLATQEFDSKLMLNGCFITAFESAVKAGAGSTVCVSRCYVAKCRDSCVLANSPKLLQVTASVLEECYKSAVEVRAYPSREEAEENCTVTVETCDIKKCRMHGIALRGGEGVRYSISLIRNTVSLCDREGIILQTAAIQSLDIKANRVSGNTGSGLWMQDLLVDASANISISENEFSRSATAYGMYLRGIDARLTRNECNENHCECHVVCGILILGSKQSTISLEDCVVHSNHDSGLTVFDWAAGECRIVRVTARNNAKSGIFLANAVRKVTARRSQVTTLETAPGVVLVEAANLWLNREFGLSVSQVNTKLSQTTIRSNGRGAIHVDEDSVSLLSFRESTRETRRLISGLIGGSWGRILPEKQSCCCHGGCILM